jgi:hypothetical protein
MNHAGPNPPVMPMQIFINFLFRLRMWWMSSEAFERVRGVLEGGCVIRHMVMPECGRRGAFDPGRKESGQYHWFKRFVVTAL